MNQISEDRRRELELEIAELSEVFRNTPDGAAKEELRLEINRFRDEVDDINLSAAAALAGKVDEALQNLEGVRTRHGLDAASALGRSIQRLREFRGRLNA